MPKIVVIGSANTDMVVKCKQLPAPGETVVGGTFSQMQGGKGANQAVAAARLGGDVTFFARVGDDPFGQANLQAYSSEGINTTYITIDKTDSSGIALIVVDKQGENYIAVASGVNMNLSREDVEPLRDILQPKDIVLFQLEIPLDTVLYAKTIAKEKKASVILNPAPAPAGGLPNEMLEGIDFLIPNEHEAAALVGVEQDALTNANELLSRGIKNVIITTGEKGCIWADNAAIRHIHPYEVKAVDTTAAGDAFAGGLAYALAQEYSTQDAIDWAQRTAAASVTLMGAQPSLPSFSKVNDIIPKQ